MSLTKAEEIIDKALFHRREQILIQTDTFVKFLATVGVVCFILGLIVK